MTNAQAHGKIGKSTGGLTLLELSFAIGLAGILLAMLLGFGKHANASVHFVRARTDLAEYGEALHQWYLMFGEYPNNAFFEKANASAERFKTGKESKKNIHALSKFYARISTAYGYTNIHFSSFFSKPIPETDPWGTPYIYTCGTDGKAYTLFSCGPDRASETLGDADRTSMDDVFFER